jgi:hypothetical protein
MPDGLIAHFRKMPRSVSASFALTETWLFSARDRADLPSNLSQRAH